MDGVQALSLLKDTIERLRASVEEELAKGSCKSFDEYRHMTGQVQGILRCEREIVDLLGRLNVD